MKTLWYALIVTFLLMTKESSGQTTNQFSGWFAVTTTTKLSDRFSLHLEGNLRTTNDLQQIQNLIFRTGLNYKLTKKTTVTAGYGYITHARTINGITGWGPENRIWEQYSNVQPIRTAGRFITLQNRFRLEQRFLSQSVVENNQLVTDKYNFIQRFRYFFRFIVPLAKTGETAFTRGSFLSVQNEVMLNIGNTSVINGKVFDQNRVYFSLGYRFSPNNDTEIGYLYQYIEGKGAAKTNNSVIQLATYLKF